MISGVWGQIMPTLNDGFRKNKRYDKAKGAKTRAKPAKNKYGPRWAKASAAFLKKNPLCAHHLDRGEVIEAKVTDHKKPHRGNDELFWDTANWEGLCVSCHNRKSASENRANAMPSLRPKWLKPALIPTILVCGPPGAGKHAYVKANAKVGAKVIDLPGLIESRGSFAEAIGVRNREAGVLGSAMASLNTEAWIIDPMPEGKIRRWWRDALGCSSLLLMRDAYDCGENKLAAEKWFREYSADFDDTEIWNYEF